VADLFRGADPGARRMTLVAVLVVSLVLTLLGRLAYVQATARAAPATGSADHDGTIRVPAARGEILDARGRPLVANQLSYVVTVDRTALWRDPVAGTAVLVRLAGLLGSTAATLAQQITPCSAGTSPPCWTGPPYQPVPVATDVSTATVLTLSEHREQFPGVAVTTRPVRSYPGGMLAAHLLGYTGAVTRADETSDPALTDADSIGVAGLEEQYDQVLRGRDGTQTVRLDARGEPLDVVATSPAQQGETLVTSIDADVQALAERALRSQIAAVRASGKSGKSGAVVVMDTNTGRVIAAASYPTFDPALFSDGISASAYAKLTEPSANAPLVGRAIDGAYAPGSTFKLISASSDVMHGRASLTGAYACPGTLDVDGRTKTNFDSEASTYPLTLRQALQVSCDTWFYRFAVDEFYADQASVAAGRRPAEDLQAMAGAFGIGSAPGIDLPTDEQATGSYADRESRLARWTAARAQYCADARRGYPTEKDAQRRAYLTQLAKESCTDGWRYRAGDNADMAIGQGETTLSPLQLAVAYSALVNGGTLWRPTIGWGVVDASGHVVRTINPTVKGHVPVGRDVLRYIADSLRFQSGHEVSGALAFDGRSYKTLLGGKTGTAEVYGQDDTSWLAAWGPLNAANRARFVVVGMIEAAGTGASAAAPMVRAVYDGLLGENRPTVLPGATPERVPPVVGPAGRMTR
jgi:penicillin-binding protein 2